ncbi:GntR family transcriptional regulator [Bradyrhizobium sp. RDM4]|uniref:GntR family transcriptional regulator n=1 Tax=Bradyrhizobium sp. RDM4 TaxID=3378765 RepID=UPI0038FC63AB
MTVKQRKDVSLYRQVEAILRSRMADGQLQPGDRLPGEAAIRAEFGVSRATVRQALDILQSDGLIDRHPGRGTFIKRPADAEPPEQKRLAILAILDSAHDMGTLVSHGVARAPRHVLAALSVGDAVHLPFLIHVVEPSPGYRVAMQHYMLPELADKLAELIKVPNYAAAAQIMGGDPVPVDLSVDATLADPRFADLLKTEVGAPLLSIWWTRLRRGQPISRSQALLSGGTTELGADR